MIKAILFDWDDVFIMGSTEGYFDCYHETLSKLGIRLKRKEERRIILENWGKRSKEGLRGLLKERPEKLNEAYKIYENILLNSDTFTKHVKSVDGIRSIINRLSKKYKLGIATGMNPKLIKKLTIRFRIPDVFSKIVSAYNVKEEKNQKPSPFMLNKLMKHLKASRNETIYIGDAKNDVFMAKNAAVTPVVVLTGHLSKIEAQKMGVNHIIKDITKIDEILCRI